MFFSQGVQSLNPVTRPRTSSRVLLSAEHVGVRGLPRDFPWYHHRFSQRSPVSVNTRRLTDPAGSHIPYWLAVVFQALVPMLFEQKVEHLFVALPEEHPGGQRTNFTGSHLLEPTHSPVTSGRFLSFPFLSRAHKDCPGSPDRSG